MFYLNERRSNFEYSQSVFVASQSPGQLWRLDATTKSYRTRPGKVKSILLPQTFYLPVKLRRQRVFCYLPLSWKMAVNTAIALQLYS